MAGVLIGVALTLSAQQILSKVFLKKNESSSGSIPILKRGDSVKKGTVSILEKTVLIDMDNTLVDFDKEFIKRWKKLRPDDEKSITQIMNRMHFELEMNFDAELIPVAEEIMATEGFYIEFDPQPGAVNAVKEMVDAGLNVMFCTAPHPLQYESCVKEKYAWVRKHFGEEYLKRLIITRDKTLVKGAILIDDKPKVQGACEKPEWIHVVFDQPYNQDVTTPYRIKSWRGWQESLASLVPY
eukprot:CAMPEP_0182443902 /NCGR_PEP_ID=MMETSP1172-20130603/2513_1 /TAXON_ID=708627 /ORGANISM="Timspurckia oligopyrenoides, Strain CCMP3278" /LENGTH=239 /DNA_ID=CAMNT_0024639315 /DNA_START=210 /DNA_END=929 /DNA_ORIENTATION=+